VVNTRWTEIFNHDCHQQGCRSADIITSVSLGTLFQGTINNNSEFYSVMLVDGTMGYIRSSDTKYFVSVKLISTPLANDIIVDSQFRNNLSYVGFQMIGWVYFWGGRSSFSHHFDGNHTLSGVDCSGLVGLIYQSNGIILPRDAVDMFHATTKLETKQFNDFKTGDLFFYGTTAPKIGYNYENRISKTRDITHVMIYILDINNQGWILEATSNPNSTHFTRIERRFNLQSPSDLKWGMKLPDGGYLYWSSVIQESTNIQIRSTWPMMIMLGTIAGIALIFVIGYGIYRTRKDNYEKLNSSARF